jgi:hypothetical protein
MEPTDNYRVHKSLPLDPAWARRVHSTPSQMCAIPQQNDKFAIQQKYNVHQQL